MNKKIKPYNIPDTVRQRAIKILMPFLFITGLGIAYAVIHKITGFHLVCPFYGLTGLYCPGCGVSRMMLSIIAFDFAAAFSSNCVLFVMSPVFILMGLKYVYRFVFTGKKGITVFDNRLCCIASAVLVLFAVIRNCI